MEVKIGEARLELVEGDITQQDVDAIVNHLAQHAQGGDVVCVFSNGGFGGIHGKLLDRLSHARK